MPQIREHDRWNAVLSVWANLRKRIYVKIVFASNYHNSQHTDKNYSYEFKMNFSKQEGYKELIHDKKTVLRLLNHQRKSLKKIIKAKLESDKEQWQTISDANLAAANLNAMRETTLKYAEEAVAKGNFLLSQNELR